MDICYYEEKKKVEPVADPEKAAQEELFSQLRLPPLAIAMLAGPGGEVVLNTKNPGLDPSVTTESTRVVLEFKDPTPGAIGFFSEIATIAAGFGGLAACCGSVGLFGYAVYGALTKSIPENHAAACIVAAFGLLSQALYLLESVGERAKSQLTRVHNETI